MENSKKELRKLVEKTIIPQIDSYINDLHEKLEINSIQEDDLEEIRNLESFLVEMQNIILAIDENVMNESEATDIYKRLSKLIEENEDTNH